MPYHPAVQKIRDVLDAHNIEYETFSHEPVRTSEEAAALRDGYTLHQGAKALIARVKRSATDKFFVMLVVPGDERFDVSLVKKLFAAKDIRFATVEELTQITDGIEPGGVPPFANLFDLEMIVDPTVLLNERIIFNAGDRSFSIGMKASDWQKVTKPQVAEIIIKS